MWRNCMCSIKKKTPKCKKSLKLQQEQLLSSMWQWRPGPRDQGEERHVQTDLGVGAVRRMLSWDNATVELHCAVYILLSIRKNSNSQCFFIKAMFLTSRKNSYLKWYNYVCGECLFLGLLTVALKYSLCFSAWMVFPVSFLAFLQFPVVSEGFAATVLLIYWEEMSK